MNNKVLCVMCKREFELSKKRLNKNVRMGWNNFCSVECRDRYKENNIEVSCTNCGCKFLRPKSLTDKIKSNHFCSKECRQAYSTIQVYCDNCGAFLKRIKSDVTKVRIHYFCNKDCKENYGKMLVTCKNCGEEFYRQKAWASRGNNFCSKDCYLKYGWIEVECYNCGNKFLRERGIARKVKKKHFCSKECKHQHYSRYGSKTTPNMYGNNWKDIRKVILERDGYSCQLCGYDLDISFLHVHHKIALRLFDSLEKANHVDNLITLCRSCHSKIESGRLHNK